MPKKKTKKAVAKRFKKTANGKVKRAKVGRRHLLSSKSRGRKRALRKAALVSPHFEKQIRNVLD
ncbi:MAG TPA: 50S ribosomal protein L35 [Kiritimatiellia bacterium]|nr:50S ribosomal protein L35 [Kiritimatiellia bacterium]